MFKTTKGFILGVLLAVTVPALATLSTLGKLELDWPDFNHPGGAAQVTTIQTAVAKIGDNMNSRITEQSAIADSTTVTLTHNFGVNFSELATKFYTGVGGAKVAGEYALLGYTIVDNPGDPKNKIDITTPVSGGPHDFSLVLVWGGGSGGGTGAATKDYTLYEDIDKGTFVELFDDGGTVKIRDLLSPQYLPFTPFAPTHTNHTNLDFATSTYTGSTGKYLMAYGDATLVSDYGYSIKVVDYNSGGTPIEGTEVQVVSNQVYTLCTVHQTKPGDDYYITAAQRSSDTLYSVASVSGMVATDVVSSLKAGTNIDATSGKTVCDYNSNLDMSLFVYTNGVNVYMQALQYTTATLFQGTETVIQVSDYDSASITYNPVTDSILITFVDNGFTVGSYLYRQTDLNTFVLLDSSFENPWGKFPASNGSTVFATGVDLITGGMVHIYEEVPTSQKYYAIPIDVSSDLLTYSVNKYELHDLTTSDIILPSNARLPWDSLGQHMIFVHQHIVDNKTYVSELNTDGVTLTTNLDTYVSSTTFPITPDLLLADLGNTGVNTSPNNLFFLCANESKCSFFGSANYFDPTNRIGIFDSPNSLAGQVGTVTLFGGVTDAHTGTATAPIYIDPTTSKLTETPNNYGQMGRFLDTGDLKLDFKEPSASTSREGLLSSASPLNTAGWAANLTNIGNFVPGAGTTSNMRYKQVGSMVFGSLTVDVCDLAPVAPGNMAFTFDLPIPNTGDFNLMGGSGKHDGTGVATVGLCNVTRWTTTQALVSCNVNGDTGASSCELSFFYDVKDAP